MVVNSEHLKISAQMLDSMHIQACFLQLCLYHYRLIEVTSEFLSGREMMTAAGIGKEHSTVPRVER